METKNLIVAHNVLHFFKHNGFRFNERKQVNNNKAPKSRIVLTLTDLDLSKLECLLDSGTTGGSRVHF